jgi:hypothetical protein
VGDAGTILHESNGAWMQVPSLSTSDLYAVAVEPTLTAKTWAVGLGGTIVEHVNGSWPKVVPRPTSEDLLSLTVEPTGEVWAVGIGGQLLHFTGPGNWSLINGPRAGA